MTLAGSITAAILEHGPASDARHRDRRAQAQIRRDRRAQGEPALHPRGEGEIIALGSAPVRCDSARRAHPDWDEQWAQEVIRWLIERGLAGSVDGNGTAYVTQAGEELSRDLSLCRVDGGDERRGAVSFERIPTELRKNLGWIELVVGRDRPEDWQAEEAAHRPRTTCVDTRVRPTPRPGGRSSRPSVSWRRARGTGSASHCNRLTSV